jgi:hypothetical protein
MNARKWIKHHGQLKKSDPNSVRKDKVVGKKRKVGESSEGGVVHVSSSAHKGTCFVLSLLVFSQSLLHGCM